MTPEAQSPESPGQSGVAGSADNVVRLSMLAACASVLQVAESLLPHPLPGVRLGLANIVTVIAMVHIGPGSAIQLAVLRTLVSSMILGTFLTPTFVLSFSGGVASALVMVLLYRLSGRGQLSFGLLGISVGGSVSHILTQIALVYLLFIRSGGVLWLWPWLALSAVVTGVVTGLIAIQAVKRLAERGRGPVESASLERPGVQTSGNLSPANASVVGRLRPEVKIAAVVVVGLAVVVFSHPLLYAAVVALLVVGVALGRISLARLAAGLARVWVLLTASLLMPVLFSPWGRAIFLLGPLRVTDRGVHEGVVFSVRILLLFLTTGLLAQTTAPREVAAGLERLLAPLAVLGVRPGRLSRSLSLSWTSFPVLWKSVRLMAARGRGRSGWFNRAVHLPGDIVADLYLLADRAASEPGPEG